MAKQKYEASLKVFYLHVQSDDPKIIEAACDTVGRIFAEVLKPIAAIESLPAAAPKKRKPLVQKDATVKQPEN
jgi:hypothetical protein